MTKVVINTCFGGFGLSNEAFERLLERKGIEFETAPSQYLSGTDYWVKGHVGEDRFYLSYYNFTDREQRSDSDLVAVVEEMGEAADGDYAELRIVEIPDDVEWHIHEYDGLEHVAEDHRTWS